MPNSENVKRPIVFIGLGRSGTSAITEILGEYPDIDNIGEASPVVWDLYEDVRIACMNMRYPTSKGEQLRREDFPAHVVREFFKSNFYSENSIWVVKPIGLSGKVKDRFINRSSDAEFTSWYFKILRDCFPEAQIYTLVRCPIEYAQSAWRYWRAPVQTIRADIEFMSVLLRSKEIAEDHIIDFDYFGQEKRSVVERLALLAGVEDSVYRGDLIDRRFAEAQGKSIGSSIAAEVDIPPLDHFHLAEIWSVIGDEYSKYINSVRPEKIALEELIDDERRDYKSEYFKLCGEYEYIKARSIGLENSCNNKEDIIQRLIRWTKYLELKADIFSNVIIKNNIEIPKLPKYEE